MRISNFLPTSRLLLAAGSIVFLLGILACDQSGGGGSAVIQAGKFTIVDTRTDQGDTATAKKNAENALIKYPDLDGMVGLWAYNIPQCLEALKDAGREGEVKLVSFDEDELTLQGIKDGHIHGTVVQQPYEFGYQSIVHLKAIHDGQPKELPASKEVTVPTKIIKADTVDAFWAQLKDLRAAGDAAKKAAPAEGDVKFAFVPNAPDPFWSYAAAGCAKAAADLGVVCDFRTPHDGSSGEQNKIMENIVQSGDYKGISISPLDPANQSSAINTVAAAMPLICNDSDAPESDRLFYIGTDNYLAGREAGKLLKEVMPEGGKIMIFVGKLDVLNAQQRRQGVIDELAGKPE